MLAIQVQIVGRRGWGRTWSRSGRSAGRLAGLPDMPTKRRKIPPRRIGGGVLEWAKRLVEHGEEPPINSQAEVDYCGWLFWAWISPYA